MSKYLVLMCAFVLVACGGGAANEPATVMTDRPGFVIGITDSLIRVEDYDAGVVCYVYDSNRSYGESVSCLPMTQTKLLDK